MPKQAFKVSFCLFLALSLLANCCISANPFDQSYAPAASESENKSMSPESLPVLPNPDSSISAAEAVTDVGTKSDETLLDVSTTLSDADEPTDLQFINGEDNLSQENASLRRSKADPPPPVETEESTEDVPAVGTKEDDNVSQENLSSEVTNGLAPAPAYVETPAPKPSDDGSFIQDNQSPPVVRTYVNAPAPETEGDQDITIEESQNPVNIVNGYDSPPKTAVPAPSEAFPFPFPFPESEPPTIDEEGSWGVVNGVVAGVLVLGACAIGVGVFLYQKRKKDDIIKAQYQCLDKKISL